MIQRNPLLDLPRYLKLFYSYLGGKMYVFFALTLIAGLADSIGIMMLLPLLQGIGEGVSVSGQETSEIYTLILGVTSFIGLSETIESIILVIILSFLIKGGFVYFANRFDAKLRGHLLKIIKTDLVAAYSRMSYVHYLKYDTGHFVNLINDQSNRSVNSFQNINGLGIQLVYSFLYLFMSFLMSWIFGAIMFVVGIFMLLVFRSLNHQVRDLSRQVSVENSFLSKMVIQYLHAFKYLTSIGEGERVKEKILRSIDCLIGDQIKMGYSSSLTESVREPVTVILIMSVVLFQVSILNDPLSNIFVAIIFFYKGLNSILGVQASFQAMLETIGSIEVINENLKVIRSNFVRDDGQTDVTLDKNIRLKGVTFKYSESETSVINSLDMDIRARTSVAIVGESGSGKSTLVDLITFALRPNIGNIYIDDIKDVDVKLLSWRNQIGYVSQETVMFNDTIANNISLWDNNPDQQLVYEKVVDASELSYISDFIKSLPDGYQTVVGDRGLRLSGGQKQRLFIARELYRGPCLLILDEATSALDSKSERQIQDSIDNLKGKITVIIIAHRLATIRNVDYVYAVKSGRVIEKGSYDYLSKREGSYLSQLLTMQNA